MEDFWGVTPFLKAVEESDVGLVREYLVQNKDCVFEKDKEQNGCLHYAVNTRPPVRQAIIKDLLGAGAVVDGENRSSSPLFLASENDDHKSIVVLSAHGADVAAVLGSPRLACSKKTRNLLENCYIVQKLRRARENPEQVVDRLVLQLVSVDDIFFNVVGVLIGLP